MSRFGLRRRLRALTNRPKTAPQPQRRPVFSVVFECPDGTAFTSEAEEGDSLTLVSGRGPNPISSACTDGTCGTCRVVILEGDQSLTPVGPYEVETKEIVGVPSAQRLGCHAGVHGPGLRVQIINVLGEELIDP